MTQATLRTPRLQERTRGATKIIEFASGATLAQVVTAVTGLILARWMTKEEYAYYTIMCVCLGAMGILSRSGLDMGLNSLIGAMWPDRHAAYIALNSALRERWLLSAVVVPPMLLFTIMILHNNAASMGTATLITVTLALLWLIEMRAGLLAILLNYAMRAHHKTRIDVLVSLIRLGLICAGYAFANSLLALALIAMALAEAFRIPLIRRSVNQVYGKNKIRHRVHQRYLRGLVKRQLPVDICYIAQPQALLLLMTIHASPQVIAEYGALSRIGQVLAPVTAIVAAYLAPKFAVADQEIGKKLLKYVAAISLPGMALCAFALFYPHLLLWPLGPAYDQLNSALLSLTISAASTLVFGAAWTLMANRGHNRHAWIQVPICAGGLMAAHLWVDLGSLRNIFLVQAGLTASLAAAVILELVRARRSNWDREASLNDATFCKGLD